ncbi:hypothetical protein FOT65_18740 [Citrobacter portucalensis]|nr:hypothetical protein [Citrobacter portucalensis]MBE0036157.1 hypothetical protein [Citrobacter portucalensis]MBE0040588.1 hypothetical protein [Citrobacter portucalensis]MBE0042639.1 hypothetical protein [Citrobacter portucalensis]MBE0079413.1 hypothetical protein [Citrobacter portucalensis]
MVSNVVLPGGAMLTGPTGLVGRIRRLRRHPATTISHVEITVVQMATRAVDSLTVCLAPHFL